MKFLVFFVFNTHIKKQPWRFIVINLIKNLPIIPRKKNHTHAYKPSSNASVNPPTRDFLQQLEKPQWPLSLGVHDPLSPPARRHTRESPRVLSKKHVTASYIYISPRECIYICVSACERAAVKRNGADGRWIAQWRREGLCFDSPFWRDNRLFEKSPRNDAAIVWFSENH